jgi:phosphoribosylaminoimidazole carboxylase PurE protein
MVTKKPKLDVGILMGSDTDWPVMEKAAATLDSFGINYEVRVVSAHRTPELAQAYARESARRGIKILIAGAGCAAHLAGVIAANTTLPVIGVPMLAGALGGLDALLSTVQMPAGVPVATVAIGEAGAVNAAILAVEILALESPDLFRKLIAHKTTLRDKAAKGNARIQMELDKKPKRE